MKSRNLGLVAAGGAALVLQGCAQLPKLPDLPRPQALLRQSQKCEDVTFPVYFQTGSDSLTPPALQAVRVNAERSRGCEIQRVELRGLADSDGGDEQNRELSRRRSQSVSAALVAHGLPATNLDVRWDGADGAVRSDGKVNPSRRRTEVSIVYKH